MKVKKHILFYILTIVTILPGIINVGSAFADEDYSITLRPVKRLIDDAAKYQAIGATMYRCVDFVKGYGGNIEQSEGSNHEIFSGFGGYVDAGAWIDKLANNEDFNGTGNNGQIVCYYGNSSHKKDGILYEFSSIIGDPRGVDSILCNWWDHNFAGLMAKGPNANTQDRTGCDSWLHGDGKAAYTDHINGTLNFDPDGTHNATGDYETGGQYLSLVWDYWKNNEEWKQQNLSKKNEYIPAWNNLESFDAPALHYIYRKDFDIMCNPGYLGDNHSESDSYLVSFGDDGSEIREYYELSNDYKNKKATTITGSKKSCQSLAAAVNSTAPAYKIAIVNGLKKDCNEAAGEAWDFMYHKSMYITGKDALSDEDKVVVTPEGVYKLEGLRSIQSKIEDWESRGLIWRSYIETTKDDGGTSYEKKEISDKEKNQAKKTIEQYNSHNHDYLEENDEGGYVCQVPEGYTGSMEEPKPNDDSSSDSVEATCMNSAGAGALAWIVCPILEWMTDATETIYSSYVEPSLEVNTSLFEDTTTRDAWNIFQGFANTCFVILILAIIFSQLTGVGIDNYGIKKMLPKLILVAILVNLSYLICILCVDLSNILGKAFKALFDGLPVTLNPNLGIDIGSSSSAGAIIAVLIAGAIFIVAVFKNPGILLTALVAILGVLIAIFFLFILLSARQAAIVILTVVSPIAFVCYILPNTKTVFDKWLKLWEAMLFLFPICGLLIGGGNFASKILLNAFANSNQNGEGGNFLGAITAMLVGIIPIFFIPTLIKGAFAAMGTLGSKITGFGDRVRGGATRRMRESEGYKNAQKMGQERRMRIRAGYSERKGGLTKIGRAKARVASSAPGRFFGMGKRQAAYIETAKKNAGINEESQAVLASETAAARIAASGKTTNDYFQSAIDDTSGDIRKLNSVILAAQKRGVKKKDIAAMIRSSSNNGKLKFKDNQSRANWMNSMLQNHGDIMSTDVELQEWARQGGVGTLGDYGSYAASNISASDLDIDDISKASSNSIAGLIKANKISSSVAQQWLAANPNASADKKIMMGAVASGAVTGDFMNSASFVEDFKKEAETLANNSNAQTNGVIAQGVASRRQGDSLSDLVESWTSTAQVRAYVSQDPSSIKPGQRQRDPVDVRIQHDSGGSETENGTGI